MGTILDSMHRYFYGPTVVVGADGNFYGTYSTGPLYNNGVVCNNWSTFCGNVGSTLIHISNYE